MVPKIVCFGETLWDIFPERKVIGGAPLNVGLRLNSLGADVRVISRIGKDEDGDRLMAYLEKKSLDTASIQIDEELPTGNVQVHLDKYNTASYTISEPVAWDQIKVHHKDEETVSESDAFIFGSLSCRNDISKNTLFTHLAQAGFKVFDANLRPPFFKLQIILDIMKKADMIKLNDEELEQIANFIGFGGMPQDDQIIALADQTQTDHLCVTLGAKGAVFLTNGQFYRNPGYKVIVKDTVGAGDSFLANLVYDHILGREPQQALNNSCALGSLVASKEGANAVVTKNEMIKLISAIN